MRTENKNTDMIDELFEHFYNQKALITTIGGLLESFNYKDSVPDWIKTEIQEIRNLLWVADTGTKQIDKIMNELLDEDC